MSTGVLPLLLGAGAVSAQHLGLVLDKCGQSFGDAEGVDARQVRERAYCAVMV